MRKEGGARQEVASWPFHLLLGVNVHIKEHEFGSLCCESSGCLCNVKLIILETNNKK